MLGKCILEEWLVDHEKNLIDVCCSMCLVYSIARWNEGNMYYCNNEICVVCGSNEQQKSRRCI